MARKDELMSTPCATASRIVPTESQNLTKERIKSLLPKKTNIKVTDEVVRLIDNMEKDTGLPQELLEEDFMSYLHIITSGKAKNSLAELANAIKFCNLKRNHTNKDSWCIVFPTKAAELRANNKPTDNFVSMYNGSKLVVAIDKEMLIPIHLQYAPYFHAAVKKQFNLMSGTTNTVDKHGKPDKVSPMVQHLAAKELAMLTRQPEETKLDIKITPSSEALTMQQEMNDQLKLLTGKMKERMDAGADIIDVQQIGLDFSEVGKVDE